MKHTPESVLMDRASQGLAAQCTALLARVGVAVGDANVVVLAGTGNNGGDALLAGELLARQGASVTGVGVGSSAHPRGLASLIEAGIPWCDANEATGMRAACKALTAAHLIVDGIVGISSKPGLREPAATLVASIRQDSLVVAVDIPSGLDADSGVLPRTHVQADFTVTFTAPKPCLVLAPACEAAGDVVVVNVGVEPSA